MKPSADPERVLVLAPLGRDAVLAVEVISRSGVVAEACPDVETLRASIEEGAGAAVLTEEALTPAALEHLSGFVAGQEPWSDFPFVVFTSRGRRRASTGWLEPLGNVVLLDRPVRSRMVVSAVQTAIRGRRRQYAARDAIVQRDRFLAILGHEIRTPLGAVSFAAELLQHSADREAIERHKEVIARQVRHLSRLVDDLLDVARIQSGKVILERKPLDLVEVAARTLETTAASAEKAGIACELHPPDTPVRVHGDPVRLEQVLINLVSNAIKYTPHGGRVDVHVEAQNDRAVLRVRDTGIGIRPELLPHVFDMFVQQETDSARARGGLGLGLTLVQGLVELHGGTIEVQSEGEGQGSEFVVRLPRLPSAAADPHPFSVPSAREAPLRVVVVEDNTDIRESLVALLELAGHEVLGAADGPSGVQEILQARPDAAVIDIGLPGLDGYGVARRVRQVLGDAVLLLALTGYGQPDDVVRSQEAGFDAHLTKPVDMDTLRAFLSARARSRTRR